MKYVALFVLIQAASLVLSLVGVFVVGYLCIVDAIYPDDKELWHLPRWAWLWDNEEDGVMPLWYNPHLSRWKAFVWAALRNSVNNLRFVRGVSKVGRPLYWRNWKIRGQVYYFKAGWIVSNGYPVLSAGKGKW